MKSFKEYKEKFFLFVKKKWYEFKSWGNQRLTIMFIPHDEKRVINFHVSFFTIFGIAIFLTLIVIISSFTIMEHSSIIKEIESLNITQKESKEIIESFKRKTKKLNKVVSGLRKDTSKLYAAITNQDAGYLWAKGGKDIEIPEELKNEIKNIPKEIFDLSDRKREIELTNEVLERVRKFLSSRKHIIKNTPSIWPIKGSFVYIKSQKGLKIGVDIGAFPGAQVVATAPGKVIFVGWKGKKGLTVTISHKYGFRTEYSHLAGVKVNIGDEVKKGQVIGFVGNTGDVSDYVCHYEVYIGLYMVDPIPYLNKIN